MAQDSITQLLTHSVEQVVPEKEIEKKLRDGKPLRIKHGIDPTGARIHIGHAVVLWKLRELQDLGHQIVLIVGDFTGMIGDTSDKHAMRTPLTRTQIEENMKEYAEQLGKILDMSRTEVRYNSEWLAKLHFADVLELTQLFTVAQLIERENFWKRFSEKKPIGLHEFLYPIMQGYDSLAIEADIELGGSDQLFNMMAGRKIQEQKGATPQSVMTMKILNGLDGRKMSKSWNNGIYITDGPNEQFGKIMSMRDELIVEYAQLATDMDDAAIAEMKKNLNKGANPKELKMAVGWELVKRYYGAEAADQAQKEFENVFSKGGVPEDIETVSLGVESIGIVDALMNTNACPSRAEAKRLIAQGAVSVDEQIVTDISTHIILHKKKLLKVGKRRFINIQK